jgi:protein involved in polysaccharide export with SLBB domain
MRKVLLSTALLLSLSIPLCAAQAQSNDSGPVNFPPNPSGSSKRVNKPNTLEDSDAKQASNQPSVVSSPVTSSEPGTVVSDAPSKSVTSLPFATSEAKPPEANPPAPETVTKPSEPAKPVAPTELYRIGIGDVLDIQLLNSPTRESTLYTVLSTGLLEYPLAGEAAKVEGMTADEIATLLASRISLYDKPQVAVTVREYASHNVIVTGLVHDPGTKSLRREAVPLFVVLAEAQPRADAARAMIMRAGSPVQTVDIADMTATSLLIVPNDVIRLVGAPPPTPQFFYIGGQIASPGQKDFHDGITLTQAILASGGVTRLSGGKIKVMRQGSDGRLVTTEYNLKKIEQGKDPDPRLEAGDRIEISRSGW